MYSDKYCALIKLENGDSLLRKLIEDPRPYERVKELATKVLDNVKAVDERMRRSRQEGGAAAKEWPMEEEEGQEEEVINDMETDDEED